MEFKEDGLHIPVPDMINAVQSAGFVVLHRSKYMALEDEMKQMHALLKALPQRIVDALSSSTHAAATAAVKSVEKSSSKEGS